jgi:hypothetical protein
MDLSEIMSRIDVVEIQYDWIMDGKCELEV